MTVYRVIAQVHKVWFWWRWWKQYSTGLPKFTVLLALFTFLEPSLLTKQSCDQFKILNMCFMRLYLPKQLHWMSKLQFDYLLRHSPANGLHTLSFVTHEWAHVHSSYSEQQLLHCCVYYSHTGAATPWRDRTSIRLKMTVNRPTHNE